ncbi:MAG: PHP domain-containing protein [Christensenellales bacterium]
MKKDMHIHTNFSDGQYSPKEVLGKVKKANITEFAITDHDNFDGAVIMQNLTQNFDVKYHVGVEISARIFELKINVHLLCYDFDTKNKEVSKIIEDLKLKRLKKLDLMIDFVEKKFGYKISPQEKQMLLAENNVVGKPHIFALLSKKTDVDRENFYRTMDDLKSPETKVDSVKVLQAFHDAGGVVVLAHPIEIEQEYKIDSFGAIKFLAQHGLDGLETEHSKHSKSDIMRFKAYAKQLNLFESYGSDFHGEKVKPDVQLGGCNKSVESFDF